MVYNGEVYNFRALQTELADLGHRFHTACDTEVVLAAYLQWGVAAFDRFNGMFAIAVADTVTGEVVLARDQFGIKPMYLAEDGNGRVVFASEIRPILASGDAATLEASFADNPLGQAREQTPFAIAVDTASGQRASATRTPSKTPSN
jgi:asparagine synthetase B (glutamine-hydrolysing)